MEENKNSENKDINLKYIPMSTEVEMVIPHGFVANMYNLLTFLIEQYGRDNFIIFAKKHIDEKVPPTTDLEIYMTGLSAFFMAYEQAVEKKGLMKEIKMSELEKLSEEEKTKLFNES